MNQNRDALATASRFCYMMKMERRLPGREAVNSQVTRLRCYVILREPRMRRVEVLRRKQGAYSGIKVVCFLVCIGRDAPFGAKPPQAGSTESLMFLAESKELFYHKDVSLPL